MADRLVLSTEDGPSLTEDEMRPMSLDPLYKIPPETLARNLCLMGSMPPVTPKDVADLFVRKHGHDYAVAVFAELKELGYRVEGYE